MNAIPAETYRLAREHALALRRRAIADSLNALIRFLSRPLQQRRAQRPARKGVVACRS